MPAISYHTTARVGHADTYCIYNHNHIIYIYIWYLLQYKIYTTHMLHIFSNSHEYRSMQPHLFIGQRFNVSMESSNNCNDIPPPIMSHDICIIFVHHVIPQTRHIGCWKKTSSRLARIQPLWTVLGEALFASYLDNQSRQSIHNLSNSLGLRDEDGTMFLSTKSHVSRATSSPWPKDLCSA